MSERTECFEGRFVVTGYGKLHNISYRTRAHQRAANLRSRFGLCRAPFDGTMLRNGNEMPHVQEERCLGAKPVPPFCSERCKVLDLGRWLGEEYRIRRLKTKGKPLRMMTIPRARRTLNHPSWDSPRGSS